MKKKYTTMLDLSPFMKYFIPATGVFLPGFEKQLYFSKITAVLLKASGPFCCGLLFIYFFLFLNCFIVSTIEESFHEQIFFLVGTFNAFCCVNRISSILANKDIMNGVIEQLSSNFQNKMFSSLRQKLVAEKIRIINVVSSTFITVQITLTYGLVLYTAIRFGSELHPLKVPGDRGNPFILSFYVFMEVTTAACYVISMTSFEWVLLTYVRLTSVELTVIRKQINAIFSTLVWNDTYGICGTTQNIEYSLEAVDISLKDAKESDLAKKNLSVIDRDKYIQIATISEQHFNKLLEHHSRIYMHTTRVKKVFGRAVALTYLYTVILSISWIISSASDSGSEGSSVLLQPFSIMAFTMLAYMSYLGEELLKAGEDVGSDVGGLDWYLYPKSMQKKLVIFLSMCQRPLRLDFMGQSPLCCESFKVSCQCCYSLFTFVQGANR